MFSSMSNNYSQLRVDNISCVWSKSLRDYSNFIWKTPQIIHKCIRVTSSPANIKIQNFIYRLKKGNGFDFLNKGTTKTNTSIEQYLSKITNNHLLSPNPTYLALNLNVKRQNIYIYSNTSHVHLFSQIRGFRSGRYKPIENGGSSSKKRTFFRFGLFEPQTKHTTVDLNKYNQSLEKEKLPPDQHQRALLAYVEGYVTGRETLDLKPWWKKWWAVMSTLFSVCTMVLLAIYVRSSPISSLFDPSDSIEMIEMNVRFSDVKGADEAKQELKNVVEFLKNPDKFTKLGGKLPKGILLVGPPGTGKTLLAKAIAGEAGVPFYSKSGAEFDEIFVGLGAKRIRDLFKLAKENTPCVIFIDEIDSIGKHRTSSVVHPHANDTINQLLTEMDGFKNNSGIIVLGATNRKDDLDMALVRPGRFDLEVNVSVPDYRGRKELIDHYLSQVRHYDIDVEKIARGTTNFTGADIESMVNQAALRAAMLGAQHVTTEHIEYARDKALMGPEKISKILDEETNKITAYHEGGHTVVAYFTEHAQPLHKVTIIARGSSLGHTSYIPNKDVYHVTKTQLLAMIDTMMGGRAAEELIFGTEKITSGASSDLKKATELATEMVKKWGMSEEVGLTAYGSQTLMSPQMAYLIDMEIKKILQESYERAKNILISHRDKHRELSEALIKYETLDAEEISSIMKGNPIRKPQRY